MKPSRLMPAPALCAVPLALSLLWASCAPSPVGTLDTVLVMEGSGERSGTYSFDLGTEARDLYFVFNNVSSSSIEGGPEILDSSFPEPEAAPSLPRSLVPDTRPKRGKAIHVPAGSIPYPKALPTPDPGFSPSVFPRGGTASPNADVVGTTETFLVYNWETTLNDSMESTCRWTSGLEPIQMGEGLYRKLSIWVADDQWATEGIWDVDGNGYSLVSQGIVEAMGRWFMGEGSVEARETNSIYRLVTDMIGAEWGPETPAGLIPFNQCVTILIADISQDDSASGGVVGYFYGGNNFYASDSNERIMFVIDGPMLANANDEGYDNAEVPPAERTGTNVIWEESDFWPEMVYSTLAHEFQHMINFYQKGVLRGVNERVWTDEMCAMSVEDLVAYQMGVPGPRGVAATDLSAGAPENVEGRIPGFNEFTEIGLSSSWFDDDLDGWEPYSLSYAFGAYLMRNYGGPDFIRRLLHTDKVGEEAVVEAVRAHTGGQEIFSTLLKRFSAAVLLSSWTEAPANYRFNNGAVGFAFTMDTGGQRNLGSINFFNYVGSPFREDGPLIRTVDLSQADDPPGYSHIFYRAGLRLTGKQTVSLGIPEGMSFSIVSLPSP